MTERKDAKPLAERKKRMLLYIEQKLTGSEIGRLEGLQADYALKKRNEVAREHGLPEIKNTKSPAMPDGIDDDSRLVRMRLGYRLRDLIDRKRLTAMDVARQVGVPRKLQKRATGEPNKQYNYDWTLSQMQKLAKAHNMPFMDLVKELLEGKADGTY